MYEIFQELLRKNNVKAYDVSKATGISTSTLTDWKKGRSIPKQDKMQKIANFFNVSVDYLMTGEEPQKDSVHLTIDGLEGFQAVLADIYGDCSMKSVGGKYGECLYFAIGTGKARFAIEESDFDRLYASAKQTVKQLTDLLAKDEATIRSEYQKEVDTPMPLDDYRRFRSEGKCLKELDILYGFSTIPDAAHTRTDIETTEEMLKHDDDIMNSDDF